MQYANELNLDIEQFSACLEGNKFDKFIEDDMQFAFSLGVQSTPTFFVNGLALVGAQPIEVFKELIDKELAGQIP
jgi:protein-disulfide isomerase